MDKAKFELALSVAKYFKLSRWEAQSIFDSAMTAVATWQEPSKRMGIAKGRWSAWKRPSGIGGSTPSPVWRTRGL